MGIFRKEAIASNKSNGSAEVLEVSRAYGIPFS